MLWSSMWEAFGVASIGRVENLLPLFDDLPGHAVMQHLRRQQGDSAVMMLMVVPGKERLAKIPRVFDGSETIWKLGPVLEGFELALRVRIIVRDMGPAMSLGHAQISHQQGHRFRGHRGSTVGVDGESSRLDALFGAGIGDPLLSGYKFNRISCVEFSSKSDWESEA